MADISLATALRRVKDTSLPGPIPYYAFGLIIEGSGAPDDTTQTEGAFYIDSDTDTVFFLDGDRATWSQVIDNPVLGDGETVLTATTS